MRASADAVAAAAAASAAFAAPPPPPSSEEEEGAILDTAGITAEAGNSESTLSPQNPSVDIVTVLCGRLTETSPT